MIQQTGRQAGQDKDRSEKTSARATPKAFGAIYPYRSVNHKGREAGRSQVNIAELESEDPIHAAGHPFEADSTNELPSLSLKVANTPQGSFLGGASKGTPLAESSR